MIPKIIPLHLPRIIAVAQHLPAIGETQITEDNLFYLKIDDEYIHQLFPLLADESINKPDYFGEKSAGAHITIIYPEEEKNVNTNDLQQEHRFVVREVVAAEIGQKTYYVLLIESPSLLKLRKEYELPELLCFKGYSIAFHITIGVKV